MWLDMMVMRRHVAIGCWGPTLNFGYSQRVPVSILMTHGYMSLYVCMYIYIYYIVCATMGGPDKNQSKLSHGQDYSIT
jgi:hypothetical protein